MIKFRTLKNSYMKLNENFTHTISEEEAEERYWTQILDEAIEEFEKDGRQTISFEEWIEEMRVEYNVIL